MELWHWITGQVWPNLFASLLWAAPTFTWHHRTMKQRVDDAVAARQLAPEKEPAA